ncbi:MAG: hypothetical protein ACI90V_001879 [Bacillariaceae sp.]|jgi:hypothetical protein
MYDNPHIQHTAEEKVIEQSDNNEEGQIQKDQLDNN